MSLEKSNGHFAHLIPLWSATFCRSPNLGIKTRIPRFDFEATEIFIHQITESERAARVRIYVIGQTWRAFCASRYALCGDGLELHFASHVSDIVPLTMIIVL